MIFMMKLKLRKSRKVKERMSNSQSLKTVHLLKNGGIKDLINFIILRRNDYSN